MKNNLMNNGMNKKLSIVKCMGNNKTAYMTGNLAGKNALTIPTSV